MLTDKTDRTLIRKLARTNVEQSFANLSSSMIRLRWLPKSNRYAENTLARLKLDAKPTGSVRTTHLSQYISASSLLHCSDGWSYLGKAIDCLLRGDPHRVVH